jgi:hypothetical protein
VIALWTGREAHFADWDIGNPGFAPLAVLLRAEAPVLLPEEFTLLMSPSVLQSSNDSPPIGFPGANVELVGIVGTVGTVPPGYDGSA